MSSKTLELEVLGVHHSAVLVPEFESGYRGIGEHKGRIVVAQLGQVCMTRHPRDVIGWRLACRCDHVKKGRPPVKPWASEQFWARVECPGDHDPSNFKVFAPDELTVDVTELDDIASAVESLWQRNHIQNWTALARLATAIRGLNTAQLEFAAAVLEAKDTGLAEPLVRSTMGLRPDEVDHLDRLLTDGANG